MTNLGGLHDALNNAAADSFEKYSKTEYDILQVRLVYVCLCCLCANSIVHFLTLIVYGVSVVRMG